MYTAKERSQNGQNGSAKVTEATLPDGRAHSAATANTTVCMLKHIHKDQCYTENPETDSHKHTTWFFRYKSTSMEANSNGAEATRYPKAKKGTLS